MADSAPKPEKDIVERTFEFARRIMRLCRELYKRGGIYRWVSYQLFKAGTSVGANTEESQAGQSRADFLAKLFIARKEARESRYWLRLIDAEGLLPHKRLAGLLDEADQLVKILTAITKNTQANM